MENISTGYVLLTALATALFGIISQGVYNLIINRRQYIAEIKLLMGIVDQLSLTNDYLKETKPEEFFNIKHIGSFLKNLYRAEDLCIKVSGKDYLTAKSLLIRVRKIEEVIKEIESLELYPYINITDNGFYINSSEMMKELRSLEIELMKNDIFLQGENLEPIILGEKEGSDRQKNKEICAKRAMETIKGRLKSVDERSKVNIERRKELLRKLTEVGISLQEMKNVLKEKYNLHE